MPKKILVIDDEAAIVDSTRNILERRGYAVCAASNGKTGLEMAKSEKPDLILTDVLMPEMDGFSFYKAIKKDKLTARVPVLIVTARGPMEDSFMVVGADGFIAKPFNPQALISKIEQILGINEARQQIAPESKELRTKKILIVSKDRQVLDEMAAQSSKAGCTTQAIVKAADAITKIIQFVPDIVFLDVQTDDISITEVIDVLRHLPKFGNKPIIGYSYYKTEDLNNPVVRQQILDIHKTSEQFITAGGSEYMGRYNIQNFNDILVKYIS